MAPVCFSVSAGWYQVVLCLWRQTMLLAGHTLSSGEPGTLLSLHSYLLVGVGEGEGVVQCKCMRENSKLCVSGEENFYEENSYSGEKAPRDSILHKSQCSVWYGEWIATRHTLNNAAMYPHLPGRILLMCSRAKFFQERPQCSISTADKSWYFYWELSTFFIQSSPQCYDVNPKSLSFYKRGNWGTERAHCVPVTQGEGGGAEIQARAEGLHTCKLNPEVINISKA